MLTKKQKELYDYLKNYISSNEISPSFEEMKSAVNLKSKSGIHRLITVSYTHLTLPTNREV